MRVTVSVTHDPEEYISKKEKDKVKKDSGRATQHRRGGKRMVRRS